MPRDDDMTPMQTYLAGGGDTSNPRVMALLQEADRGHHRRLQAADGRYDPAEREQRYQDDQEARDAFLQHCRPATPGDYTAWLHGYRARGGRPSHDYDYPMPADWWVLESAPASIPSLYGALSVNAIVPAGVLAPVDVPKTFHGVCGHSSFFFMDGFEVVGSIVPSYTNV